MSSVEWGRDETGPERGCSGLRAKSGQDHLGLGSVSSDRILPALSPGINVLTVHPRYWSFYTWVLDDFWAADRPRTRILARGAGPRVRCQSRARLDTRGSPRWVHGTKPRVPDAYGRSALAAEEPNQSVACTVSQYCDRNEAPSSIEIQTVFRHAT